MAEFPLKSLNPSFRQGSIRVRVSRLWEFRGGRDDGQLRHIDLVLLDAENFPMYGEIGPDALEQHRSSLVEGRVYKMTRFRVINARNVYRPVDSKFMIDITVHTIIQECSDVPPNFPMVTYRLTPFPDLAPLAGEIKSFVDIIGMITEVGEIEHVQLQYQPLPTTRRTVILRDTNNFEMKLLIWGAKAFDFDAAEICALSEEKPVVGIFVGILVKSFRSDISLSANSASRWYLNLDVPEVNTFLSNLPFDFQPVVIPVPADANPAEMEPHLEPELKTVKEIVETSPYDFPRQGYRCSVTISKVNETARWYFASCNRCTKACYPDGSGYKCSSSSCDCTSSKFKYKVCLFGTDGTAEAEFIFFGELGRRLVGKELKTLMRSCSRGDAIPSEIAALVCQKYQLTVNVSSSSFKRAQQSYTVKSIDCAYGRQPAIPPINPTLPAPPQTSEPDKNRDAIVSKTISSAPTDDTLSAKTASTALLSTPDNKLSQGPPTTPPPLLSPLETPAPTEKIKRIQDKQQEGEKKVCRKLFKKESASSVSAEDEDASALDDDIEVSDDEDNEATDDHTTARFNVQSESASKEVKKGPPAKRAKKN